jgi:hypothetical protein
MQRRHAAKPVHLADRKIADSDGADLSLCIALAVSSIVTTGSGQ